MSPGRGKWLLVPPKSPGPGANNYDDDFNSDSTDFEEVGEGGQVTSQIYIKQKKGKFDLFQEQFEDDPQVDMIGELFYSDMAGTISTRRILSKWVKRYCVARDMHLLCYNGPKKGCSLDIPLPGHRVELRARTGGKKNVLIISHQSKGNQLFSCRSKEEAERWLEVLQDYATMGHEIEPNSGYIESTKEEKKAKEKNKKEKKKDKKEKKKECRTLSTPQLSTDINGVLSGFVNLYGVYYGESKWKKHWISIKDHTFNCHLEPSGTIIFQFDLRKTSIDLAEEKRENAALKIFSAEETYVMVEALNVMDNGQLLKSLVAGISAGNKKDQKQNSLISTLMAAFEKPKSDDSEPSFYEDPSETIGNTPNFDTHKNNNTVIYFQHRGSSLVEHNTEDSDYSNGKAIKESSPESPPDNLEELYLEILSDYCQTPLTTPQLTALHQEDYVDVSPEYNDTGGLYLNFRKLAKLNLQKGKTARPDSLTPRSPDEDKDEKPTSAQNDKTTAKKSAFSRFFKSGNAPKDDIKMESPSSPSREPASPAKAMHNGRTKVEAEIKTKTESDNKTKAERPKVEKKISRVAPGQPDLVLASKLQEERTEMEAKRKELNQKKKDLRLKKFSLKTDEERDKNDDELRATQREWNEVNNKLVDLDRQIFLAKNGNSEDAGEDIKYTNTYPIEVNRREPGRPQSAVVRRTSYMNRQSAIEAGTISENEKVTTGTVQNMKSLFQGN